MGFSTDTLWFEVALMCTLFAVGHILLGHFEERTPRWRKLAKLSGAVLIAVLITVTLGRTAFLLALGVCLFIVLLIHAWWLPRLGINGWTAEPKDKYYRLRGWTRSD